MSRDFAGFTSETLAFLRDLAANNDPAWFKPRKEIYETVVRAPLSAFIATVTARASRQGLPLKGDSARSIFRVYRDIRFARDKRPYNTAARAALTRSGARHDPGVLYIHIEPCGSFLGCGFWQPPAGYLDAWRREMVRNPVAFLKMVAGIEKKNLTVSGGEMLKRLPRGFESARGTPIAPYLLWKSFVVNRALTEQELGSRDLAAQTV